MQDIFPCQTPFAGRSRTHFSANGGNMRKSKRPLKAEKICDIVGLTNLDFVTYYFPPEDRYGYYNYLFGNFLCGFPSFYYTWNHAVSGQKTSNHQHGRKPPRENELTSVAAWNHRHGRNFIILGCALFITLSVFAYFLEKLDMGINARTTALLNTSRR